MRPIDVLKVAERKTIAADADDPGRRAGDDDRLGDGIDAAGVAAVDRSCRARSRNRADRNARSRAERNGAAPSVRAAATVPASVRVEFADDDSARASARRNDRTDRHRARPAVGAAARRSNSDFAEDRNVDKVGVRLAPGRAAGEPFRRTPRGDDACGAFDGEGAGLGEAEGDRSGQDQRAASIFAPLTREDAGVERMMQHESAAAEQPRQQRQADAGKGGGGDRR